MNRDLVISIYPKAVCREISSPSGSYYMIYDMDALAPDLIGYDMESEDKAWETAASHVQHTMIRTLES